MTTALLDEAAIEYMGEPVHLSEASLRNALDPEHFVKSRTLHGGPAPEEARRQIAEFQAALERDRDELEAARRRIGEAHEKLEAAVDAVLATH